MIFSSNAKPKVDDAPRKLRHILADQVKPKVFDFDRNRYKEMNPKRKPGGPLTTSQLGDMAAMKKRAEVAAIPDVVKRKAEAKVALAGTQRVYLDTKEAEKEARATLAEAKKKGGRPKKK